MKAKAATETLLEEIYFHQHEHSQFGYIYIKLKLPCVYIEIAIFNLKIHTNRIGKTHITLWCN